MQLWSYQIFLILLLGLLHCSQPQKAVKRNGRTQGGTESPQENKPNSNDSGLGNENDEDQNTTPPNNEATGTGLPTTDNKPPDGYDAQTAPNRQLLTWHENPASEITISWTPSDNASEHKIYLSTQQRFANNLRAYEISLDATELGMNDACNTSFARYGAQVKNLKPNTVYFYVVVSGQNKSMERHFVTAPNDNSTAFKLLSGGDSRSDSAQRIVMNKVMQKMVDDDSSYLALVHGGDFVAQGGNCGQWKTWLSNHQEMVTSTGRFLPLIATFGNHEIGGEGQFQALFGHNGSNDRFYFHSKIGMVDLIVLNSEISVEGDQMDWLKSTLGKVDDSRFIVASYHRPAFSAQKSPGSTTAWVEDFENSQVNLVLESDGHVLKQTCPIKDNACNSDGGVIYVGEGGLGVAQRDSQRKDEWYFEQGGYAMSMHHVQSLSFSPPQNNDKGKLQYSVFYNNQYNREITISGRK